MRQIAMFVLLSLVAGCVGFDEAITASTSYKKVPGAELPPSRSDSALVFFYGENQIANQSFIYHRGERVTVVGPAAYSFVYAPPGENTFTVRISKESSVTMDLVAGETYYVMYRVDKGWLGPQPNLTVVPAETGRPSIVHLKYIRIEDGKPPRRRR